LRVLGLENRPMERRSLALVLQQRQKVLKESEKITTNSPSGHFQSDAVLCHTMFFAHKNNIYCIRLS
jgi:hypothetical protein